MTVTRLWQAGAELQHINELDELTPNLPSDNTNSSMSVSSTKSRTGGFSFRTLSTPNPRGKAFPSTTQIRAGVFLNHSGLSGASSQAVLLYVGSTINIWVQWNSTTSNLELYINTTLQASVAASTGGFSTTDTWRHLGITCKADATAGFVSFYIDGVLRLTYTGNTGTGITSVAFGGNNNASGNGFTSFAYFDDFYVDDTVGEADAAPPSPRFPFLIENGAGNYTNWSVNTGTNTAALDDGVPDDDTTYTYATSSGVKDSFTLTNTTAGVTVPAGYSIEAVIPIAWARKTDAGTASTLKLGTRLSSTDSVGSAQTLATSYGPAWVRQTTKPGGGAWTESDIDSAEVYLESAGSY